MTKELPILIGSTWIRAPSINLLFSKKKKKFNNYQQSSWQIEFLAWALLNQYHKAFTDRPSNTYISHFG